jgi:DNA-binding IscR family transcriptional regulator
VGDEALCTFDEECPLKPVWSEAQNELVKRLKGTNFAQLLEKSKVPA